MSSIIWMVNHMEHLRLPKPSDAGRPLKYNPETYEQIHALLVTGQYRECEIARKCGVDRNTVNNYKRRKFKHAS